MKKNNIAIGLFSGGLDSILAIKIIEEQGVTVKAVSFTSPFFGNEKQLKEISKSNNIDLTIIDISREFIKLVKNPVHGYGKNLNPCIDCKIFMLKFAKKLMKKWGAQFIFTGEVMDQRPMSQRTPKLHQIAKESGLNAHLLRPLSAKLLPITTAEQLGLVDREKLQSIQGRSRKTQFKLADFYNVTAFTTPAGGCLLTDKEYTKRFKTLLMNRKKQSVRDICLLKFGRHFWDGKTRIIVGRHYEDNIQLHALAQENDYLLEMKDHKGPTTLIIGAKTTKAIQKAAQLTARYSGIKSDPVSIKVSANKPFILTRSNDTDKFLTF